MSVSKPADTPQAGFTLVELIVSVTVFGIIGVVFIGLVAHYFVIITRTNKQTEMTVNSQNLLRNTVENIRLGDGVRETSQISDPNAPGGGWNTNNSAFVIVIAVPALNSSRNYITNPDTGSPYMNELVYYKDGDKLMQRKLANPQASGNTLVTSCPQATTSTSCPADIELAAYVRDMTFTLYDQDSAVTNNPALARSVKIHLTMERNAPGDPLNVDTTTQVTLRNRF